MPNKSEDDPIKRAANRAVLPATISQQVAIGGQKAGGNSFDPSFYEEIHNRSRYWQERVGTYTKMGVLVPAGGFSFFAAYSFPDLDISTVGIGNHRFFLVHSGAAVWMMRKVYKAHLSRTEGSTKIQDKITRAILGVMGGSAAFAIGCHLLVDTIQPKSVVFPFFGSLINGTLVDDNIWLFANGVWCFRMGADMYEIGRASCRERV